MYLIRQDLEEAIHVMTTFRERCEKEAPRLLDNIDAFLCRLHLYRGDTAEILAWMDTAPDENREFYILERFRYLTKARVYRNRANTKQPAISCNSCYTMPER